ncbi:hypothetical protein MXB_1600 [Myxobolus squamalis]|nr:hypothetical protein MXB_1600 [Myxobolus squamalis]
MKMSNEVFMELKGQRKEISYLEERKENEQLN